MNHQRMGQSPIEGLVERLDVFTNESAGLSITQRANQRTDGPIAGSFTESPIGSINARVGEWGSQ